MESQKELHERLEATLKKAEEALKTTKRQLEEETEKVFLAKKRYNNMEKSYYEETFGFNFNKIENDLLESVYKIINP